jgi:hypothetical protein
MSKPLYGTATFASAGNVTLIRSGLSFDGSSGQVWEEQWVGSDAGIAAKYVEAIALGGKARRTYDQGQAGLYVVYARDPNDVSPEVPYEEWDDDVTTEQTDLFSWAPVVNEAKDFVSASTNRTGTIAAYRKDIKDAVDDGLAYPLSRTSWPVGAFVYDLLSKNVTSIPLNRPTLTRTREFSSAYTGRNQMTARQSIWTTAALISAFNIPAAVQSRLPDDPPANETPSGTVWAWRLAVDRSSYNVSKGKIQEVKTWEFAAWVSSFFNYVT